MKKINFKPLVLLLPLAMMLVLIMVIDFPNKEALAAEKEAQAKAAEEAAKTEAETTTEGTNAMVYTFVVGQKGSLEGGYAPIYDEPDVTSEQIGELQYNCVVLAEQEQGFNDWVYVDLCDKGKGYVKKDLVKVETINLTYDDPVRNEIIQNAMSYLGLRFVKGGQSLVSGLDCTNFASQIYALSKIDLPNTTYGIDGFGQRIEESEMQPGDIIYYDKANDGSGHVGIYIGGGYIINSAGHSGRTYPEGGVRICCLKYQDRDHYYPLRIIGRDETNTNGETDEQTDEQQ